MPNRDLGQGVPRYALGRGPDSLGEAHSMLFKYLGWSSLTFITIVFVAILSLVAMGLIDYIFGERVSNDTVTRNAMWVVKRRILLYAHQNNRLPKTLVEIPTLAG